MIVLKKPLFLGLALMIASLSFATGVRDETPPNGKPKVAVSILPQSYFLSRIGGDRIDQFVLVGPGQSPHAYEPTPKQMAELAASSAWILSNTDFEISLKPKVAALYPSLKIVDGTEGVTFRAMEAHSHEDGESHEAEKAEAEAPGNIDRHTWLGRESALILARHIRDTLTALDPAGKTSYEANYAALTADIEKEFSALKKDLAPLKGRTAFVYHPAFGYFFDEFGINQEAVETGGKEPSPKALQNLIEEAKKDGTTVIFVQAEFPTSAAKTLADALGAQVVPLDSLAPDWLANIRRMGDALKKAASSVK